MRTLLLKVGMGRTQSSVGDVWFIKMWAEDEGVDLTKAGRCVFLGGCFQGGILMEVGVVRLEGKGLNLGIGSSFVDIHSQYGTGVFGVLGGGKRDVGAQGGGTGASGSHLFHLRRGGGVRRERTGCVLQAGGGREVPWFPPQKIESRLDVLATCMSGLDSRPVAGALHPAYPKHAGANSLPAEQHVHVFRPNGWLSRV